MKDQKIIMEQNVDAIKQKKKIQKIKTKNQ